MNKNNILSSSNLLVCLIIITLLSFLPDANAYRPLSTEDAGVGAMGEIVVEAAYENAKEEGREDPVYQVFGNGFDGCPGYTPLSEPFRISSNDKGYAFPGLLEVVL